MRAGGSDLIDAGGERAVRGYTRGLHPETLRIFDQLGVMPSVLEAAHRIDQLSVRTESGGRFSAALGALDGNYLYALVLRQFDVEEILQQALERRGGEGPSPACRIAALPAACLCQRDEERAAPGPGRVGSRERTMTRVLRAQGSLCHRGRRLLLRLPPRARCRAREGTANTRPRGVRVQRRFEALGARGLVPWRPASMRTGSDLASTASGWRETLLTARPRSDSRA